jgi:hypothetical protein
MNDVHLSSHFCKGHPDRAVEPLWVDVTNPEVGRHQWKVKDSWHEIP